MSNMRVLKMTEEQITIQNFEAIETKYLLF